MPRPLPSACPSCGGTDFRSLEMVHAAGSSHGTALLSGVGSHGTMGYGAAFSHQQSDLARSVAPPRAPTGCLPVFVAMVSWFIAIAVMLSLNVDPVASGVVGIAAAMILGGVIWYPQWRFKRDELPKLLHDWRQTFMCMRCGYRFRR